jgi:DNA polymerase III delta prime subunit
MDINKIVGEFSVSDSSLLKAQPAEVFAEEEPLSELSLSPEELARKFSAYDDLIDSAGRIIVPLHEPDSAELTDQYILYSKQSLYPAFVYQDTERDQWSRISADQIEDTVLGWRLRFWSPDYQAEDPPETLDSSSPQRDVKPAVVYPDREYSQNQEEQFYEKLQRYVGDLQESERGEKRESYRSLSPRSYRRRFGGIPVGIPIGYVDTDDGPYCTVIVPDNVLDSTVPHDFDVYPNNEVLVDVRRSGNQSYSDRQLRDFPLEGVVNDIEGNTVKIHLASERNSVAAKNVLRSVFQNDSDTLQIGQFHNPVPFDRKFGAIREVRDTQSKRDVVTGNSPLLYEPASVDTSFDSLNQYQAKAAKRALAAEELVCIHGPPGTGKTRTLVALIEELVSSGQRVLACSHSNQATDNLLAGTSTPDETDPDSLHASAQNGELSIARVGSGSTNPVVSSEYGDKSFLEADVTGATMSAAAQFDSDYFDVAIVDEASQASIPDSLLPFSAADRVVLAGDHKQLPPYASQRLSDSDMALSLFEFLLNRYGDEVAVQLRKQYRMHPDIASFPSQQYYDGKLTSAEQTTDRRIDGLAPVEAIHVNGSESQAKGHSWRNTEEARVIATEVTKLLQEEVSPSEIGVITPYSGQIKAIRDALSGVDDDTRSIKIDTIDSFQGGEREAILVSFVRSNPEGETGFLTHPVEGQRRLNVALTRAKRRLVLIGDWETLCQQDRGESDATDFRELRLWLESSGRLNAESHTITQKQ